MPRVGQNPLRQAQAEAIKPIVLSVVTHLPSLDTPYHAQRMEVVQACITSMRERAGVEHTLAVWDNGSCTELRQWLQWECRPDVLILAPNVGKTTARTSLFRIFPPDTIVAYSDDDMLFYPNWLQPQIDLLNGFPNVACVTGYPCRTSGRWGCDHTKQWARENAKLEVSRFIPQQWEDDFALSIGRAPEAHRIYSEEDIDYRITYQGMKAYAFSHHCQFIARAGTVADIGQYDEQAMAPERGFDIAMDRVGLRLSTTDRLCRHIGNVMDDRIRAELASIS